MFHLASSPGRHFIIAPCWCVKAFQISTLKCLKTTRPSYCMLWVVFSHHPKFFQQVFPRVDGEFHLVVCRCQIRRRSERRRNEVKHSEKKSVKRWFSSDSSVVWWCLSAGIFVIICSKTVGLLLLYISCELNTDKCRVSWKQSCWCGGELWSSVSSNTTTFCLYSATGSNVHRVSMFYQ